MKTMKKSLMKKSLMKKSLMKKSLLIAASLFVSYTILPVNAARAQNSPALQAAADRMFNDMFAKAPQEWQARVVQDETQKICSETKNEPSDAQYKTIVAREKAAVVLPADGKVIGDWKAGRTVAQRGTGGQFSDAPGTFQGGNCYACHQLSKEELSFGNLGPSLTGYGKDRRYDAEEAQNTYAKIYNAQSVQACSTMPRFGHNKFLTEQQIKDVVAYLFDPESPVNK
jgi:L-cysteine S-thiosulfotransferase